MPRRTLPHRTALHRATALPLVALLGLAIACGDGAPDSSSGAEPPAAPEPTGSSVTVWKEGPAASNDPAPPPPLERSLRAGFLVVDGVYNTELTAPYDILEHTVHHTAPDPGIEVFTVSPDGEVVTTAEGLRIVPDHSFASAPEIDILIVPSAENSRGSDLENRAMIEWVRRVGNEADAVVSLCWGAFVLAEAGLLDGLSVTTFPSDVDRLAEAFPAVRAQKDVSFVHHGKAMTSQGGVRSFDVAMYLVETILGREAARNIGGGLLIDWPPRPGTTPPFLTVGSG